MSMFNKESPLAYWWMDNDDRGLEIARLATSAASIIGTILVYAGVFNIVASIASRRGEIIQTLPSWINTTFGFIEILNIVALIGHGGVLERMKEEE